LRGRVALLVSSFYHRAAGDVFEATVATTSPWDARFQHAGPPLALIARLIDERFADDGMRIGRMTIEILGPIPKVQLTVETKVLRPGKRIKLVEATLLSAGNVVLVANVWRFSQLGEIALPPVSPGRPLYPLPDAGARLELPESANEYFRAFEWRYAFGSRDLGPAAVWCRSDLALIEGEPRDARDLLLALADSANGISIELPLKAWFSIPTSVTVSLARDPVGEWVYLEARTLIGPDGRGVTTGFLGDLDGEAGNIVQALLVSPR